MYWHKKNNYLCKKKRYMVRQTQRNIALDVIRVLACTMVVVMHSPMPGIGTPGFVLSAISYITAPCIGLFFMVSGALLLPRRANDSLGFDTKAFLTKRFSKILYPTIFWTIIGVLLEKCGIVNTELGVLWFMYTLAGLYLLTPILSRWINAASNKEIGLYLCVWLVTLCVPIVELVVPVNKSDTSWLYYFHGYAGYYVMGGVASRFGSFNKTYQIVYSVALIVFSVCFPLTVLALRINVDFYSLFWYLSITVVLMCVLWWKICHKIKKVGKVITTLSELSFGIYLVHILIMRNVIWEIPGIDTIAGVGNPLSGILQIVITTILTICISAVLCYAISKTPVGVYIIGLKKKR